MRYNPCGAVVDFGRYPYDEWVRPFRNSDQVVKLRWYPVSSQNPALPFESQFMYQFWDKPWIGDNGVYFGPDVEFPPSNLQKEKKTALGNHICGDALDFAEGGLYLPLEPPVQYRPDGLPMCCSPVFMGVGGGVGSGTATVTYSGPYSGSGGGVGGGTADYRWGTQYVGVGGGVGGGTATVVGTNDRVGTGGGVASGEAGVAVGVWVQGVGGGVGGGAADVVTNLILGSGGGVGSGKADVFTTFTVGSGGGIGDGTADVWTGVWIEGTGGAIGDGTADVWTGVWIEGTGGAIGDGTADVWTGVWIEGTGGGVGSGEATVTYTPPGPGPTCATAYTLTSGVPYFATPTAGVDQWYTFPVNGGGATFTTAMSGSTDPVRLWVVYLGDCSTLVPVGTGVGDATIPTSVAGASTVANVQVIGGSAGSYTITFTQL